MSLVIDENAFFNLVDQVLIGIGRGKLSKSHRSVVQVFSTDRVLQVLAGPGSGKTEAIVWRVLFELLVRGTPANRILVTTFTRRAATELEVRLAERSDEFITLARANGYAAPDPQIHDLRVGTIHSLCDSLLAEFDDQHVEAGTEVIDEAEANLRLARVHTFALGFSRPPAAKRVINRILDVQALTALFCAPWESNPQWPSRLMERVAFLNGCIAQHVETWLPRCHAPGTVNGIEIVHKAKGLTDDLIKLQSRWETYLDQNNLLDFTTLQKRFLERQDLIRPHFDHVFVDEFQDSNPIQFAIHTNWLSAPNMRLTVVGDDDQAIYRFRGSDIDCFRGLAPFCSKQNLPYRQETLDINFRSTKSIVGFTESFRNATVLQSLSLPKVLSAPSQAKTGKAVRLLTGAWEELCKVTAAELHAIGAGRPQQNPKLNPTAAIMMFSTSERESRDHRSPALALRLAIESRGLRVYNPRNKMAGAKESAVARLFGLVSYLIDPVSLAPVGKNGRVIEVWASADVPAKALAARSQAPPFPIAQHHASIQKAFLKGNNGKVGTPAADRKNEIAFVDDIRKNLAALPAGSRGRLTLSGFIARLLSLPLFRNSGFTVELFRQALFTQLLESNVAPTRLTKESLDQPLEVTLKKGRYVWPPRYWSLLNTFGGYLEHVNLDDLEVESFEEDATLMITFHQAKGLEFDQIYVASTGREPDLGPALRTRLFSGDAVKYRFSPLPLTTKDAHTNMIAIADREREVYVGLTRGRHRLTILYDPAMAKSNSVMQLNPAIESIFAGAKAKTHPLNKKVSVREFMHA